jgi:Tol biopolymer transport system component
MDPQISKDGRCLAYLAPDKSGVLQIWVQTIGKKDARMVTHDKYRGNPFFAWTYVPDTMIYVQDNGGDEEYHLYSINLQNGLVRDLTPFRGVRLGMSFAPDRNFPNQLLVGLNLEDRRRFDI